LIENLLVQKTPNKKLLNHQISFKWSQQKKRKGRSEATTWPQRTAIITWLEKSQNFALITGNAAAGMSSVVAGAKLKKSDGYLQLADFVNESCGTRWDKDQCGGCYRAYVKLYKDTRSRYLDNGGEKFCLGEADYKRGIRIIEEKLNHECPHFERLDNLFGGRQNIQPT
jgi:hypothetical protein